MALSIKQLMLHRESTLKNCFIVIKYKPTLFFSQNFGKSMVEL